MMQAPPLPPPSHTSRPRSHSHNPNVRRKHAGERVYEERVAYPWEDMAHTYAWVAEQEYNTNLKQSRKPGRNTEEWVFKQAMYYPREDEVTVALSRPHPPPNGHPGHGVHRSGSLRRDPGPGPASNVPRRNPTQWEEVIYRYEVDAERWMRHEEESRRLAEERMRARARIEDEFRRIDERVRQRREEQRRMFEESRARTIANMREHERRERMRLEKAISDSWEKYESRWSELTASSEPLTFANIPWPTVIAPRKVEDITSSAITSFLLSSAHSQQTATKDRLRSAQLRWHPDRFRRLINRVTEEDKEQVEEAVGVVARVLNELMQREKRSSK